MFLYKKKINNFILDMGSAATSTSTTGTQTDGKHHVAPNSLLVSTIKATKKNEGSSKK